MTGNAEPNGLCWCGCGTTIGYGRYFAAGHDKVAEAAYLALHHDGSVAHMLHKAGYGPSNDKSVTKAAVDKGLWQECPRGCGYRGAQQSIINHVNRHHKEN